ncbi:MAG: Xaa-Pro aminopeptidase [Pyrinomonadaceae bacterium]
MRRPQLDEFMRRMEPDSIAIISSAPERTRSNDTEYRYRQDSNFYYLTGFNEPEAIAVIAPAHPEHKYQLFVRPRDPERETWDGHRAGVEGAVAEFGAHKAHTVAEFHEQVRDLLNGARNLYYRLGVNAELDEKIIQHVSAMRARSRIYRAPDAITDPGVILHEMRLVKTADEIELMQRSADIAAEAHVEAMKAVRPGMNEYEIEALIEYIFRRNGAAAPAYNSIVGGGANATVLHYVTNDAPLRDGDLLLVDAGAEYCGYASDITRTFPVNGRYTEAQRDVYNAVLETQMACVEMVKPGVTMGALNKCAAEMLTERMVRLGLLDGEPEKLIEEGTFKRFYMHMVGHFLGMDVHDVGRYQVDGQDRPLEPGIIITIEPGLYIAENSENIPDKYRGIGVRIEDDVLVTPDGHHVLTAKAPKQIEEIESLIAR